MSESTLSRVVFSTGKDDWETPADLFAALDAEFHFQVDVAANAVNHKTPFWFGPDSPRPEAQDALAIEWPRWTSGPCWCNPPYSRGLQPAFIAKAAQERRRGVTTVMLLPARTDTKAFHAHIWDERRHQPREGIEVRLLRGRLRFVGADAGAPFPSMIVVFHGEASA